MTRPERRLGRRSWRGFWRDQRGVSAVEFALIAPALIAFYFGFAETTQAMMAKRRASHVASTIGDLVAQQQTMDSATMTDLFTIGATVLAPFPTTSLKMRVTSVSADAANKVTVDWSKGSGMTALGAGGTYSGIPAGLIAANQSLIVSEVTYSYDSPIKKYVPNTLTWSDIFYLRPRIATKVACPTC
jgi:Flp pilus assembly protein TadG